MDAYNERKNRRDLRRPRNHIERDRFAKYGLICELFFGAGKQIPELMRELKVCHTTIATAIEKYLGKNEKPILITFDLQEDSEHTHVTHHPKPTASKNRK